MAKSHFYSASNKIQGTLNNHGLSLNGNSFQGSILYFGGDKGASAEEDCRKALFLTNPADDRGEVETNKPPLVRKVCEWIHNHASFKSWANSNAESQLLWISGGSGMGKTMMSLFLLRELEMGQAPWATRDATILFYFIDTRNEKRNTAVSVLRGLIHLLLRTRPALMSHLLPDFEVQRESLFAQTSLEALWRIFASMLRDPATGTVHCLIDGLDECREDCLHRLLRKVTGFFEEENYRREVANSGHSQNPLLAKLKMILVSREAPSCISDNLSNYPRINIPAVTTGRDGSKPKTKSDNKSATKPVSSAKPASKFSAVVTLAVQKKNLGLTSKVASASQSLGAGQAVPQPQGTLHHNLAGLPLANSSATGQIAAELPTSEIQPPVELPTESHSSEDQATGDEYVFDEPVEDSDQETPAEHSTEVAADTIAVSVEEEGEEGEDGEEKEDTVHGALDHYIDAKVVDVSQEMGYGESLAAVVSAGLRQKGDGSFLWVDLAIDQIKRYQIQYVEQVVEQLLPGVDDMYCRTLQQIPQGFVPLAVSVLRWVLAARRPMYFYELSAAISLMGFNLPNPMETTQQVVTACGTLLAVKEDTSVHIPHTSVKDLLTAKSGPLWNDAGLHQFYVDLSQVDGEIAALCIRYLEQGCLEGGAVSGTVDNPTQVHQRLAQFPFLAYAVEFWPVHLRSASNPQIDLSSPFFVTKSAVRKNWWLTYYPSTTGKASILAPRDFNLLHMAAYLNIPYIAQQMELKGLFYPRLNSKDSHGSTPLASAASMGNLEMFIFLLQRGASQECIGGETVFSEACWKGQSNIAEYLLNMGYDVNKRTIQPDGMQTLKMLGQSARWAHGLVSEGIKLDRDYWKLTLRDTGSGETALHTVAFFGHTSLMKLLLSRGAHVTIPTTKGWTALHSASWTGQIECVKVLLQHGANALDITDFGWNALHCAASRGKTPLVSFLLEYGMSVDILTVKQKTALHLAAYEGRTPTIKVLAAHGAILDAQSHKGETPLHLATRNTKPEAVEALLALGANRLMINAAGHSPVATMKLIKGSLTEDQREVLRILETFGMPGYIPWQPKPDPNATVTTQTTASQAAQSTPAIGAVGSAPTPAPVFQAQFQFVSQTANFAQQNPHQPTANGFPSPQTASQFNGDLSSGPAPPPYSPSMFTQQLPPEKLGSAPELNMSTKPPAASIAVTSPPAFVPMTPVTAPVSMTPMTRQQTGFPSPPQPSLAPELVTPQEISPPTLPSALHMAVPPPPIPPPLAGAYSTATPPALPPRPDFLTTGGNTSINNKTQHQPPAPSQFPLTPPTQANTPVQPYQSLPYGQPQDPSAAPAYPFPTIMPQPAPSPTLTPATSPWQTGQSWSGPPAPHSPAYNAPAYPHFPTASPPAPQQYGFNPAPAYQYPGQQPQLQQQQASFLSVSYAGPTPSAFGRQQGGVGAGMQFLPPPGVPVPLQKKKSLLSLGGLAERAEKAFR